MKYLYILLILVGLTSCAEHTTPKDLPIDGLCEDCVRLSTDKLHFDAKASGTDLLTGGSRWWLRILADGPNDIVDERTGRVLKVEKDWIAIIREPYRLRVEVKENTTSQERKFEISLTGGNCFSDVYVTQAGKKQL